ncbi:FecR domain-containing protein [Brevundimonas sp. LM2]|uniref:FecR family protein n=1 Tax=Brevundimonas sp. LM2 TaxID=1938605 RepID=UPI0015C53D24|nr:FecR domain-containing protein [Brevundimonas sp. LM2]
MKPDRPRPDSPETPDAIANRWWVRLQSGEATDDDVANLRSWLAARPEHQAAFDRVKRAWHGVAPLGESSLVDRRWRPRANRRTFGAGLATAAAAVLAIIVWPELQLAGADERSGEGEVRMVSLPDGGTAWLDTDSAFDIDYSVDERRIVIRRGQAWFDVAPETRPFLVKAGDATITDIGTVFGVRRDGGSVNVVVREGEVRMACVGDLRAVLPNQSAVCGAGELSPIAPVDASRVAEWQTGRLTFAGQTVGSVLSELDRYTPGPIWVRLEPSARQRRVTALFELADLDAGLQALATTEGLRITRWGPVTIVSQDNDGG